MACEHKDTSFHDNPWPTGEVIEECGHCGMSRLHCEMGASGWTMVADIDAERTWMERSLARNHILANKCPVCPACGSDECDDWTLFLTLVKEMDEKET